jgi:hypothetical protein
MTTVEILTLVGLVLVNGGALILHWLRMIKDITNVQTRVLEAETKIKTLELKIHEYNLQFKQDLQIWIDKNDDSHERIINKIDKIKDDIIDIKVSVSK